MTGGAAAAAAPPCKLTPGEAVTTLISGLIVVLLTLLSSVEALVGVIVVVLTALAAEVLGTVVDTPGLAAAFLSVFGLPVIKVSR